MIEARFVPLERWPGERTRGRQHDRFKSNYIRTLDLLECELKWLRAKDVVIQSGFTRQQLRNDGWPRAGERPTDPGIIISFQSPKGPLSFPCDRYNDFQANIRAIALSLEALRAVDRYGVTRQAEQYKGWQQIEAPGSWKGFKNSEDAARFLCIKAYGTDSENEIRNLIEDAEFRKNAYRRAASKLHPDQGGSHEEFVLLQESIKLLDAAVAKSILSPI